jgi:hypothetical protein
MSICSENNIEFDTLYLKDIPMLPTCSTPYEPKIKRRNRPPPVQVTRNILSMKQYDVLSVQKEKSKVEIEKN